MSSNGNLAAHARGYAQGIADARKLLEPGIRIRAQVMPPTAKQDRLDWLDGYTLGMRRVVLDAKLGRPWRESEASY